MGKPYRAGPPLRPDRPVPKRAVRCALTSRLGGAGGFWPNCQPIISGESRLPLSHRPARRLSSDLAAPRRQAKGRKSGRPPCFGTGGPLGPFPRVFGRASLVFALPGPPGPGAVPRAGPRRRRADYRAGPGPPRPQWRLPMSFPRRLGPGRDLLRTPAPTGAAAANPPVALQHRRSPNKSTRSPRPLLPVPATAWGYGPPRRVWPPPGLERSRRTWLATHGIQRVCSLANLSRPPARRPRDVLPSLSSLLSRLRGWRARVQARP